MAKDDFEDFLSRITFAESRGKRTDSSGKLLEGPMTKYGTAKGELQVLDSTNKKPGYGVVSAKDDTPDERARVGRDYLKAMLDKFKDKRTAAIAYNWGPGNTQKWLDAGADEAGLPKETQNYVKKVMGTETAVAKAPAAPDMAPAPRQAAGAPSVPAVPANRPTVSRETMPAPADRLSALGPSYQAAMALSFLGDTTNPAPQEDDEDELRISGDESRSAAREDDDVTKFLTGPSARSALADFDFKIQSPFAERPVRRMAGGGEMEFKKDKEPSFDEKVSEGMSSGEVGDEGRYIRNSKTVSSKQLAELLKESNASLPASSVTSNAPPPRYINYDLNVGGWTYGFGPLKGQIVISGDKNTPQDPKSAMDNVNTQAHEAYHQRAIADKHSLLGKDKIINDPDWLARRRLEEIMEEFQPDSKKRKGSAPNSLASSYWGLNPNRSQEEQIANLAGYEGMHPKGTSFVDTEVGKKMLKKYPSLIDYYFTQSSVPYGGIWEGQSKEPGMLDNAAQKLKKFLVKKGINTVNRAKGSPEEGEISQEEIDAASKPSFRAQSSGMNRQRGPISDALNSGEAYTAVAKGLTNLPYNLAGGAMDLAMLARQGLTGQAPAGQVGTSEFIKNKMTQLGIRQPPPTDPTLKGFYELGDLGSNLVNPAAPVRGAAKVAEKTGEAAKMLAKDFQQYNQQLAAPGASYAVRAKGTPTVMSPLREPSADIMTDNFLLSMDKAKNDAFFAKNPDLNSWDYKGIRNTPEFKDFSASYLAPRDEVTDILDRTITQVLAPARIGGPPVSVDPALNNWFSKTFARYLRSDFASPGDQLVKAADEGKLLHLAPKELWADNANDRKFIRYLSEAQPYLTRARETEGFSRHNMAKTEYGERIEDLTDAASYPEMIGDLLPHKVPISMRGLVATNPEARAMDFSPDMVENLKLPELRDKMLELRQSGGQYSAYGQPAVKIPPEFLLPDDTLAKLNVAAASNRVARFTGWQDEIRKGMATTSLRTNPQFRRDLSSDGKYVGVFIPDLAKPANQELKKLVTDVGCDGGWCTRHEEHALGYGSGNAELFLILTNEGKKARPVAQISVYKTKYNEYLIKDIAGKDNSYDFANNPALPAIQEYVKELDYIYGGFKEVDYLKELGMMRIPEEPMKLLNLITESPNYTTSSKESLGKLYDIGGAGTKGMSIGLGKVAEEAVRLNEKSFLLVGNEDTLSELLQQALKNVTTPQKRAKGGFMERESNDNRKYL
jgi:hypothetical protein